MALHPLSEFYREGGYTQLSKINCRILGTDASVLLGYLSGQATRYSDENKMDEEEFFYKTQDAIEFATGLTHHKQRKCYKILKEMDLIEVKRKGNPAKNYYKINFEEQLHLFKEYNILIECVTDNHLQEYSSLKIKGLVLKNLKVLLFKNLRSLILSKNLIERNNSKEKIDKLLSDLRKDTSSKKPKKDSFPKELISFQDSLKYFPEEYQKNKEFKKMWRRWLLYRQNKLKNPVTLLIVKKHAKELPTFLGLPDSIDRLYAAIDSNKWTGLVFKDDKDGSKQKSGNGNGGNGNGKQPEPIKEAKMIIDAFEMESPNIKRLNTAVQETEAYLDKWTNKWYEQRKGTEAMDNHYWSMATIIPGVKEVYGKYIESLSWVNGQPNEALFDFGNTQFIKFRKQYQKNISGVNWETGGSL
jgi:hypothetical protein